MRYGIYIMCDSKGLRGCQRWRLGRPQACLKLGKGLPGCVERVCGARKFDHAIRKRHPRLCGSTSPYFTAPQFELLLNTKCPASPANTMNFVRSTLASEVLHKVDI